MTARYSARCGRTTAVNTANDDDALRVVTAAKFSVPHKASTRRVRVRVVDVFGFEAQMVQVVAENGK